jgi:hypothetical protein
MNADEIVRALRCVQEKHKNDHLLTFQTNVSAMARDAADMIESLQAELNKTRLERNAQEANKNYYKAQLAKAKAEGRLVESAEVIDVGAEGWAAGYGQCSSCVNGLSLEFKGYCSKCGAKIEGEEYPSKT